MAKVIINETGVEYSNMATAKKTAKALSLEPSPNGSAIHISDVETGETKYTFYNGKQVIIKYVIALYNTKTEVYSYLAKEGISDNIYFDDITEATERAESFRGTMPEGLFQISVEEKILENS